LAFPKLVEVPSEWRPRAFEGVGQRELFGRSRADGVEELVHYEPVGAPVPASGLVFGDIDWVAESGQGRGLEEPVTPVCASSTPSPKDILVIVSVRTY